ncbi:uncharacterized protein LOC111470468 [Cucurbita maxima]|uniref:Uncharacterized protein LOC111470468 n=1 Tax=Cucurbita maxima TaxID=3661 RepID=A0A6J1I467_CUCMA|nr:uncharacterized protein LOC111470468 [Cucurbita maxima]
MEAQLQLRKTGTTPLVDATNYCSIVGSLNYLVNTRLDLVYFVGYVSRFMEALREEHLVIVMHFQHYVAGTRGWGVRYCVGRGRKKLELVGYSDSDMGVWLAQLMKELIGREGDPPMLYVDNKSTISLIKNPIFHDWIKHIEIRLLPAPTGGKLLSPKDSIRNRLTFLHMKGLKVLTQSR